MMSLCITHHGSFTTYCQGRIQKMLMEGPFPAVLYTLHGRAKVHPAAGEQLCCPPTLPCIALSEEEICPILTVLTVWDLSNNQQ